MNQQTKRSLLIGGAVAATAPVVFFGIVFYDFARRETDSRRAAVALLGQDARRELRQAAIAGNLIIGGVAEVIHDPWSAVARWLGEGVQDEEFPTRDSYRLQTDDLVRG